jgi:uncharacterized protein
VAEHAPEAGIRTVLLRFGMVLSPQGGALAQMLPVFRWGLGGTLGNGSQYMSWITLEDTVRAIEHVIATPSLKGPANVVAPNPVTNTEFTRALARTLSRPAFLPIPAFVLRLLFGEIADEVLLSSARVIPQKLLASGFEFKHPTIEEALRSLLAR